MPQTAIKLSATEQRFFYCRCWCSWKPLLSDVEIIKKVCQSQRTIESLDYDTDDEKFWIHISHNGSNFTGHNNVFGTSKCLYW